MFHAGFPTDSIAVDGTPEREYIGSMKVKTSITLSQELLKAVDKRTRQQKKTRSDFIETAVRAFLKRLTRGCLDLRIAGAWLEG